MQSYTLHGESAPAATFAKSVLDPSHNGAAHFDPGYNDKIVFGTGNPELKRIHDELMPSATITQVALDGTHNGALHIGSGYYKFVTYNYDSGLVVVLISSVMSFIGYGINKLNTTFMVPFTAVLSMAAQGIKSTVRGLSSGINFRTDFIENPSPVQLIQVFFSGFLRPVSVSPIRTGKAAPSALSFSGFQLRPHNKILTAALSFVGAFLKRTLKAVQSVVSLTIALGSGALIASNLMLAGTLTRIRGKFFTPTLSFVGLTKKLSLKAHNSSLSFVTTILHSMPSFVQSLTAAVSFSGFFSAGKKYFQSATAALSFSGAIHRFINRAIAGALSFIGTPKKRFPQFLSSALSFTGFHQIILPTVVALSASLSFAVSYLGQHGRIFLSSLSFVGRFNKFTSRLRTGSLSFVGLERHARSFIATASLSFSGFWTSARGKTMTSVLSFAPTFYSFLNGLYRLQLQAALAFSALPIRSLSRILNAYLWPGFTPKSIPGLRLWLSASNLNLNDGDRVSLWPDFSGLSLNASASGTDRPTFRTNVVNGKPAVRFDGSNLMTTARFNLNQPDTLIAVAKQTDKSAYAMFFTGAQIIGGLNSQFTGAVGFSNGWFMMNANFTNNDFIDHSGAFHVFTGVFQGSPTFNGYGLVDGVQTMSTLNVGSSNFDDQIMFGRWGPNTSSPYWMIGDIAELIAYDHALTTSEMLALNGYLGDEYGISIAGNTTLFKNILKNAFQAAVNFTVEFIGHIPGFFTSLLTSALNFTSSFATHIVGQTFVTLTAALSFVGLHRKRWTYALQAAAISFAGTVSGLLEHFAVTLSSAVSFVSDWSQRRTVFVLSSFLSFHGQERSHWSIPFRKAWAATLSFVGDIGAPGIHAVFRQFLNSALSFSAYFYTLPAALLFEATLRFRGIVQRSWDKMRALFYVLANVFDQKILFSGEHIARATQSMSNQQLIDTTPTLIDFLGLPDQPLNTVFIKNLDAFNSVRVDNSTSFSNFPQTIAPGAGVLISPQTNQIWAIAVGAPVMIEVIAGK